MAPQYVVQVYTSAGTLQATVVDYLAITVQRVVNGVDILTFSLGGTSASAQYISYGAIVEVYRSDTAVGIASYREFAGVVRSITQTITDRTVYEVGAVGWNALLGDRQVAYYAGVANRTQFTAVVSETIMKTLWNFNVSTSATTANGRFLDGRLTGATAATSGGAGNSQSISVAQMNLLSAMQKIQLGAGGDFAVSYTAPATWTFNWYTGQLGTDRSASVTFSVGNGTIGKLVLKTSRIQDVTAVIVGGQGEGSARAIVTRPASLPTGLDLREGFVDARNQKTTAEYQQLGTATITQFERQRTTVDASVLQSDALRYGRDYFFGDLVSVYTGSATVTRKVASVELRMSVEGAESINVELIPN
jgi:Siphovirus ReqiPepy6 Gp37-like protein